MRVHVHSIIRNEEKMLPYFLRHYEAFCEKIFLRIQPSTDKTLEIAKAHPKVTIIKYKTEFGGGSNSYNIMDMQEVRNNDWKKYSYLEAEKIDLKIGEISPFPQESHLGYTIKYVDKKTKEAIGYHLRKGSFLFKHEDPKTYIPEIETPEDWQNNKKKACKIFWNEIKKAKIKWQ